MIMLGIVIKESFGIISMNTVNVANKSVGKLS